jgi:hypothetical protein
MQMHFYVADAEPHHLRNTINDISPVLLLRVEEAVLGALPRRISRSVVGNSRPVVTPMRNATESNFNRRTHSEWLIVVCDCYPGTFRLLMPNCLPKTIFQVRREPKFCVSREFH